MLPANADEFPVITSLLIMSYVTEIIWRLGFTDFILCQPEIHLLSQATVHGTQILLSKSKKMKTGRPLP